MKTISIGQYRILALAICTGLLSSCSNMADSTKTYMQAMGITGAGGAAIGGLGGFLIGGDTKSTLIGTGIGVAAGIAGGYFWGDSVVEQKREYASMEEQINHSNQVMEKRITQARQTNSDLKKRIAELQKLNKTLAATEAKKEIKEVDSCISLLNEEATLANLAAQKATGSKKTALQNKISTLNGEINTLKKHKKTLSTLSY